MATIAQIRLDPDLADRIDAERGEESRTGWVNDLLRETFEVWDTPAPAPRSTAISTAPARRGRLGRVRPAARRV